MPLRLTAAALAALGGVAWVARWAAGDPGWGAAAHVVGLVLLGLALAVVGAGLVTASWLRAVVGVALPALVWSVYVVVRGEDDAVALDGVIGVLAVVWGLAGVLLALRSREPAEPKPPRRRPGSHAR